VHRASPLTARPNTRETKENTMTAPVKRGLIPGQVQLEQRREAERRTAEKQVAQAKAIAKVAEPPPTALAADVRTPQQKYVDEIAPGVIAGRLVKFSKEGVFMMPDTEEAISQDKDFIALCDETLIGWIKFNDDAPPDRVQGLLYDGFVMVPRGMLGDLDQARWPIGLSGQPTDPWQHQVCLVLQEPGTHELFTFATTSTTGRRAIGNLLRHYDGLQRSHPDHHPVVRLKAGGFNHRDERIGWVHVPVFACVGRAPKTSAAIPDTSIQADLNDEIPI
jgi:hypothetical protein